MSKSIAIKNDLRNDAREGSGSLRSCVRLGMYLAWFGFLSCLVASGAGDVKVQASRAFSPVFPYDALIAGRGGSAEVKFTVDHSGRAIFAAVVTASEPAFGQAFMADIDASEFLPPRVNGRPIMTQTKESYTFPASPPLDAVAKEILAELRKPTPELSTVDQLDRKLEPIRQPLPAYPWSMRSDGVSGEAEIEFIIDRDGRPLFPRIVSATYEEFGWAAATAIQRWRYKSPMKSGAKVDVRVTTKVIFDIKNSAGMW